MIKKATTLISDKKNKRYAVNALIIVGVLAFAMIGMGLLQKPSVVEGDYKHIQIAIYNDVIADIQKAEKRGLSENKVLISLSKPSEYVVSEEAEALDAYYTTLQSIPPSKQSIGAAWLEEDLQSTNADIAEYKGIGIIMIDKIGVKAPVVEGVTEDSLKVTVGRVSETAQIGEIGNAVIAGHRNYSYPHGEVFNRLGELEMGDVVKYHARNGDYMEFVIFEEAVITPDDQIAFIQPVNDSIITLFTCSPLGSTEYRLILRAIRVL